MSVVKANRTRKHSRIQTVLLLLTLLTSPLFCCGCVFLLEVLPPSLLPSSLDFMVNLFEEETRVENRSEETLYLTPITTTYGRPMVITQLTSIRLRDIPLRPGRSFTLTSDAADMPLAGIVVCRTQGDCRLLATGYSNAHYIDSFEDLPELEASWLQAVQSTPQYNFAVVLLPSSGLIPVVLFLSWLYLGRLEGRFGRHARASD